MEIREKVIKELRSKVIMRDKAVIIEQFADMVMADAENYALEMLLNPQADLSEVAANYRAALAFYQKIEQTIATGTMAERKLKEME